MKEQPFYIGQKVVCIKGDTTKDMRFSVIKGQLYTVKHLKQCKCGSWKVDVGFAVEYIGTVQCLFCKQNYDIGSTVWVDSFHFAPLQEGFEAITFERVMEEEKVSVN